MPRVEVAVGIGVAVGAKAAVGVVSIGAGPTDPPCALARVSAYDRSEFQPRNFSVPVFDVS